MQNVSQELHATTRSSTAAEAQAKETQSAGTSLPPTRSSKKKPVSQSNFLVPIKYDPDELRIVNNKKRLSRTSPYAAHVHAAFAKSAVFWNRAMFPRIVQTSLASNDKRRKQISLCEQRLLAVCVMQYGKDYEVCCSSSVCCTVCCWSVPSAVDTRVQKERGAL